MSFIRSFLDNHVLANLVFLLIIIAGWVSYALMPRSKDPEINFNWINITTFYPGAAARDVERRVTDPLEQAIERGIKDIRFVSSTSRDGISNILIRFEQIDERTFDKRVVDLRREIQNTYTDELPDEIERPPNVFEFSTSNGFPTANVVVRARGDDENLRRQVREIRSDIERIRGVDRITETYGVSDPELHVAFDPGRLTGLGVTPADLADTVRGYFRDVSAGDVNTPADEWVVRIEGTFNDPGRLARFPVLTASGVVELGELARIYRSAEEASEQVRYHGDPASMLVVTKTADANVLDLIERINAYITERNALAARTGVSLHLVDDQTVSTRQALRLMQTNALIGLVLVLLVAWLFLGSRIAGLTAIGIPFTLGGTFLVLNNVGFTLDNTVLLGVVISLGMLVDDAVVVVESIYERMRAGMRGLDAAMGALGEVFAPVTASVLTTIAVFFPLTLIPGILGEFMKVIPLVVCLALAISLLEAYWMLPAHVIAARIRFDNPGRVQRLRTAFTHWLRLRYTRALLVALRHPIISVVAIVVVFALAGAGLATEKVKVNFFAADPIRLFYVSLEAPAGTRLEDTGRYLQQIEQVALAELRPGELRDSVAYAGLRFTQTEPLFGDDSGQVLFSLAPAAPGQRGVYEIADAVEAAVRDLDIPGEISLLRVEDGPPTERPINIKIRGNEFDELLAATTAVRNIMNATPGIRDVSSDFRIGKRELLLRYDGEAIKRAGLEPVTVGRSLMAMIDGEIVTTFQDRGEEVRVRVLADTGDRQDIDQVLQASLSVPGGGAVAIGDLLDAEYGRGQQNIRHYNFRRTITLDADIDTAVTDTVTANQAVLAEWEALRERFPNVSLDLSGQFDDINESLSALKMLFFVGLGLVYAILGTQFRSYFQPLMILVSIPLAFTGVVLGLMVSGNPLSLYTLYGVVALSGIAVNAAIVLISAANDRLARGMSLLHATVFASRRRVVPILITSLTTIAGLFSLAAGIGGKSLVWGPVATAIVWGLAFSTVLTLFVIPLLYRSFMARSHRVRHHADTRPAA